MIKFDWDKWRNEDDELIFNGDDLYRALEYNIPLNFKPEDIEYIVAEVCGENDEYDWWWVLKMKNGKFFLLSGRCDYTGWYCQSSIEEHGYFNTALEAVQASPESEEFTRRNIKENLMRQVKGEQPFGTYVISYN